MNKKTLIHLVREQNRFNGFRVIAKTLKHAGLLYAVPLELRFFALIALLPIFSSAGTVLVFKDQTQFI